MNFLSRFFGSANRYDDAQLVARAMQALAVDPMINDPSGMVVTCKQGVITVAGIVNRIQEKDRIEGVIRTALTAAGIKHERIINELKLPNR